MATTPATKTLDQALSTFKTPKERKEPVPVFTRINAQIKRAALNGKLSEEELSKIAALCEALKLFVAA